MIWWYHYFWKHPCTGKYPSLPWILSEWVTLLKFTTSPLKSDQTPKRKAESKVFQSIMAFRGKLDVKLWGSKWVSSFCIIITIHHASSSSSSSDLFFPGCFLWCVLLFAGCTTWGRVLVFSLCNVLFKNRSCSQNQNASFVVFLRMKKVNPSYRRNLSAGGRFCYSIFSNHLKTSKSGIAG